MSLHYDIMISLLWCHYSMTSLCCEITFWHYYGMALLPYFMTSLPCDVLTLNYDLRMLRCLYLTFWWHYILKSLLNGDMLHYGLITLHYDVTVLWHYNIVTSLWDNYFMTLWHDCVTLGFHNVMTLLSYLMTSLHYDVITLNSTYNEKKYADIFLHYRWLLIRAMSL